MYLLNKLREIATLLSSNGVKDAAKESEILITEALKIDKSALYSGDIEVSSRTSMQLDSLAIRRSRGEPLQYIIGHLEFYGLKINVGRGVLIPRPETEMLVDEAIKHLEHLNTQNSRFSLLDLCTGSGCIAVAIAKHFPRAIVCGIDKSEVAVHYASQNASENTSRNINFVIGDLYEPLGDIRFDCIVSNPPYVKSRDIEKLQREIRDYEPIEALDGGDDGLEFYRKIFKGMPHHLKKGGLVFLEIGFGQSPHIETLARTAGIKTVGFLNDFAGIRRVMVAKN